MPPIGLLAGWGRFPYCSPRRPAASASRWCASASTAKRIRRLAEKVDAFYWSGLADSAGSFAVSNARVSSALVMAGKVHKAVHLPSVALASLLAGFANPSLLVQPQTSQQQRRQFVAGRHRRVRRRWFAVGLGPGPLPGVARATRTSDETWPVTARKRQTSQFGWRLAQEMGRLDVGQSVAVKERAVIAVEAIEGTDRAILRAGELCRAGGFVVVKVAKPKQDMRFDVPTIGCSTLESLHKAGGRVLAIEADKTIVVDQPETVALADKLGLTIVAMTATDDGSPC